MKTCLFDIDGTLVMTGGAGQEAFAETFSAEFGVESVSDGVSFAGRSDRAIATDLMNMHGVPATDENWNRFRDSYVERLVPALERCVGEVLPGVLGLIDRLEQRGDVHIGLLTGNIRRAAERKLGYYGLWDRFGFGGFGDDHTDRNDIAATAVAEARRHHAGDSASGETIVVIGDTPNDIRCGRSVGAKVVAVPTGHTPAAALAEHAPDLLVDTLESADGLVAWFDE